jgi:hypothetical protein
MKGALIVGIEHYGFDSTLTGCNNDAKKIAALLSNNEDGSTNFEVQLVPSDESMKITRTFLRKKIKELFEVRGDVALFYFSGHGTENNLGGYIVTQDAVQYDEGISLNDILALANQSNSKETIIILDSCHSGGLGNFPGIENTAIMREGLSILTASRKDQKAYESAGTGVFSSLLIEGLQGWAADLMGKVTIASLFNYAEQAMGFFDSRPLFKSHVSQLITIRKCIPVVTVSILKRLTDYFHNQEYQFPLDKSFEDSIPGFDPEKAKIFKELQKCRAAGLLIPVGYDHMYDAAYNCTSCKLTPQGKYYWFLAKSNRL